MKASFLAIVFAMFAVAAPFGAAAQQNDSLGAGWREQQNEARRGVQQGNVSLAQVIEIIRRMTPGRQLDAGLETAGGRQVYRVRWAAADGRRIDYLVDAKSGAILSAGGG